MQNFPFSAASCLKLMAFPRKKSGRDEAGYSPLSSAEVKDARSYKPVFPCVSLHGVKQHRKNSVFKLYLIPKSEALVYSTF